jgi:predicted phage-related endonuclease
MGFLESLLAKVIANIVDKLWAKLEERLEKYFEMKSQIKGISTEANALKEELKNATTDAERIQILRKIAGFQDRIGN